ncbi:MAG: hypothetical protein L0Y72_18255 [Gemmataceae bacterium]|nr:hypothetical protein [Gemmataceae bacterium]MCI0740994.1 hypothetical protein [Gemmataceae bacterium]
MKQPTPETVLPAPVARMANAWSGFWFTPRDPSVLGIMRLLCGAITLYTVFVYSFRLQDFVGEHAWLDLEYRLDNIRERPYFCPPLSGTDAHAPVAEPTPGNAFEEKYFNDYVKAFQQKPYLPFPRTQQEAEYTMSFREKFKGDLRLFGLRLPRTAAERDYLEAYTAKYGQPPPEYLKSSHPDKMAAEQAKIDAYIAKHGVDPRRSTVYTRGTPIWSLWFHVTDPTWMAIIHGGVVLVTFLFMIGFATRVTSVLTWMCAIWYIHRTWIMLFGVDTMMVILLLYLAIGPSGAAYSVDRLIARWWSKNKARVVNRWRAFWGKPALADAAVAPASYSPTPMPSVSANVAIRLLQIHLCIIYFVSGVSKLQGAAWWNGTAVWYTIANFEFAPMQFEIYNFTLRSLARRPFLIELFLVTAGYFTLAFEIGYAFLVWRPSLRWVMLSGAIMLHGLIGIFMGLKTFSFMMLVLNMAFLKPEEVRGALSWLKWLFVGPQKTETKERKPDKPQPATV